MDWPWLVFLLAIVGGLVALGYWSPSQMTVFEFERGLRYRNGRFAGVLAPGRHWYSKRIGRITKVDVRPVILAVPGQELLTSDGIAVKVSLLATYEVADVALATNKVQKYVQSIYSAVQVAVREEVAALTIEQLIAARSELGKRLLDRSALPLSEFGVTLRSVDLRDVMLPGDIKRAFAQELAARKEGAATLEKARGETAALRNLANAARMLEDNPALYQLRLLQQIGGSTGNTVVVGQTDVVPMKADRPRRKAPDQGPPPES
jgi:regulator of protease activity HflC (stomatin/prohibitin superfamily)